MEFQFVRQELKRKARESQIPRIMYVMSIANHYIIMSFKQVILRKGEQNQPNNQAKNPPLVRKLHQGAHQGGGIFVTNIGTDNQINYNSALDP